MTTEPKNQRLDRAYQVQNIVKAMQTEIMYDMNLRMALMREDRASLNMIETVLDRIASQRD